jgi:hypothetical protein
MAPKIPDESPSPTGQPSDGQPPDGQPPDWKSNAFARSPRDLDPATYARLRAEVKAPYRGFRKFIYAAIAGSGFIGGVVFLAQIAAGRNLDPALPNFAIQAGVVGLMALLFHLEKKD